MKRFAFFFLIAVAPVFGFSQETQESKVLKEAFLDGEYFLAYEDYLDALPFYQQVYKADENNANINYKIGLCYLNITGQKEKAIPFFEKAIVSTTNNYREGDYKEDRAPNDAFFFLGIAYQIQEKFPEAESNLQKYLELLDDSDTLNLRFVEQQISACAIAQDLIQNRIYFNAENLGVRLNSSSDDYQAVVAGDGNSMVFISSQKFYDALFYARKRDGRWGAPVNITPDIKSDGDFYPTGLSYDGSQLLLTKSDDFNSDIYTSTLEDGNWKPAQKIKKGDINSKFWESHAIYSKDGKTMYFTSSRGGGYGGLDIYSSQLDESTGIWGKPTNLGPNINSIFNEETPFLCNDDNTLYFASQGHTNMGGFDIFKSNLNEDGSWTAPENIGYPINTTDDDMFFIPMNQGNNGYMSFGNIEGGSGKKDIYYLEIFSDKNPRPVEIKGSVSLAGNPEAGPDKVTINIQSSGPGFAESIKTASPQGQFSTSTKLTGKYNLQVESEGYIAQSKTVTVPGDYSLSEIVADFELQPVPVVEVAPKIVLRNIYFEHNSSILTTKDIAYIKEVVSVMNEYNDLKIMLVGYCDNTGSEDYNIYFSQKRAKSVGAILTKHGISKDRFEIKGMGETNFLAINSFSDGTDAPEGRKFNRRVEFHIISGQENIIPEDVKIPANLKYNK